MARPAARDRHADEAAVVDRRWFALIAVLFALTLAAFFLALWLFHVTGPHPEIWAFIHRLRGIARWVLPRWTRRWRPD